MSFPDLPPQVPRRGNALTRGFGRGLLWLMGWRLEGNLPNQRRMLVIVAPHTSNWDWVVGILTIIGLGVRITWLGKHTLFEGPLAWLFRSLGGVPVNRKAAHGVVEQIVAEYGQREDMVFGLAPEGTRSTVSQFRSGYHRIAVGARVPLIPAALDFENKRVVIDDPFALDGDLESDTQRLQAWYRQFRGRNTPAESVDQG